MEINNRRKTGKFTNKWKLIKEIEDTNKWKEIPYSWVEITLKCPDYPKPFIKLMPLLPKFQWYFLQK